MQLSFKEQATFSRVREDLFGDDEGYRVFQNALMNTPRFGDVIPGTGGARKIRWSDPQRGKGKRSGIRVIYYYHEPSRQILFIYAYDKNTPDLRPEEKKAVRAVIEAFRKEREA
jgi:mRNA-degrading endonuclease RelE of RelBE toxin-antitoxin system